jgi:hypothetical protein
MCVAAIKCSCENQHIIPSQKTIAEQAFEYGRWHPYKIYWHDHPNFPGLGVREAPVNANDKFLVLNYQCIVEYNQEHTYGQVETKLIGRDGIMCEFADESKKDMVAQNTED